MAALPKLRQQPWAKKTKKHAKAVKVAMASAAVKAVMANAVKAVAMAAVVDVMAAVVNAAKVLAAKSAHPAKGGVAVKAVEKAAQKAATNCVKAKPAPHAANVLSVVSAQNVLLATVLPVKAVATVVARAAMKAETKAAAMQHPS